MKIALILFQVFYRILIALLDLINDKKHRKVYI